MISAEVSLYPVETTDSDAIIIDSLRALDQQGLEYSIGSLSTHFSGEPNQVWSALQSLYGRAQATGHEVVMVVTIANAG